MRKRLFYQSNYFSLHLSQAVHKTYITMQLFVPIVNTRDYPHTSIFLQEHFPSVLRTECFNDQNLPFIQEVQATEIGHLFEHILLDQLCFIKLEQGAATAMYSGRTDWNWHKDPMGMFHISVDAPHHDFPFLLYGVEKTTYLVETLMGANPLSYLPLLSKSKEQLPTASPLPSYTVQTPRIPSLMGH